MFLALPNEIQTSIVDFLTIDDWITLSTISETFLKNLNNSDWAKKLFERYIQNTTKSLTSLKISFSGKKYFTPSDQEFKQLKSAKALFMSLLEGRNNIEKVLLMGDIEQAKAKSVALRIEKSLSNPCLPILSLRRENEYIETATIFEDFLSETYFRRANAVVFYYDEDYKTIKKSYEDIQTKSVAHPRMLCTKKPGRALQYQRKAQAKAAYKKKSSSSKIETLPAGVLSVVKAHCNIIKNYLLSIADQRILLKEYVRCWKEFSYSLSEVTILMQPYEDLKSRSQKPLWFEMVSMWASHVYQRVSQKLEKSFLNMGLKCFGANILQKARGICNQEAEINEKDVKLLTKVFVALSDISLFKNNFVKGSAQTEPKFNLINALYPEIKNIVEKGMDTLHEVDLKSLIKSIKEAFSMVSNDEIGLSEDYEGKERTFSACGVEEDSRRESINQEGETYLTSKPIGRKYALTLTNKQGSQLARMITTENIELTVM